MTTLGKARLHRIEERSAFDSEYLMAQFGAPDRRDRLSPSEAKACLVKLGWTNRALALWWGCREEYVSKILNDAQRKRHFDDAIRGLPHRSDVFDLPSTARRSTRRP